MARRFATTLPTCDGGCDRTDVRPVVVERPERKYRPLVCDDCDPDDAARLIQEEYGDD